MTAHTKTHLACWRKMMIERSPLLGAKNKINKRRTEMKKRGMALHWTARELRPEGWDERVTLTQTGLRWTCTTHAPRMIPLFAQTTERQCAEERETLKCSEAHLHPTPSTVKACRHCLLQLNYGLH